MAKSTPTFVVTLPLLVPSHLERKLIAKFEAGRKVRNALVGEGRKRLRILKNTPEWRQAASLSEDLEKLSKRKDLPKEEREKRVESLKERRGGLFKQAHKRLEDEHCVTIHKGRKTERVVRSLKKTKNGASFRSWSSQFNYCDAIRHHLDSQTIKSFTADIQKSFERSLYGDENGKKAGLPNFRRFREVRSVSGLDNKQGILWRGDKIGYKDEPRTAGEGYRVVWKAGRGKPAIILDAILDREDSRVQHGLKHRVKYCRVVWRSVKGQEKFFVQLVLEGHPLQVRRVQMDEEEPSKIVPRVLGQGAVGFDLGPSTIGIVSKKKAELLLFCQSLADMSKQERRIQRQIGRQKKAANPDNYNADGQVKRGVKLVWKKSKRCLRNEAKLADLKRRQAATRKTLHGALVNEILTWGDTFITEDVSVKDWAKRKKGRHFSFGKSISAKAPATFTSLLQQRVEQLGGTYIEVPTYSTALSKSCQCGVRVDKGLSKRWHKCSCGADSQRDLYSAFLCLFVEDGKLNCEAAEEAWEKYKPVLDECVDHLRERKRQGERLPSSFGI